MLSNINIYASCAVCVTIFSTGGKFHPVSIFTLLHALTLVAHSYVLLFADIVFMDGGHVAGVAMVTSEIIFSWYGSDLEYNCSKNFRSVKVFRPMVSCTLVLGVCI